MIGERRGCLAGCEPAGLATGGCQTRVERARRVSAGVRARGDGHWWLSDEGRAGSEGLRQGVSPLRWPLAVVGRGMSGLGGSLAGCELVGMATGGCQTRDERARRVSGRVRARGNGHWWLSDEGRASSEGLRQGVSPWRWPLAVVGRGLIGLGEFQAGCEPVGMATGGCQTRVEWARRWLWQGAG